MNTSADMALTGKMSKRHSHWESALDGANKIILQASRGSVRAAAENLGHEISRS